MKALIFGVMALGLCGCNATIQSELIKDLQTGCTRHYDGAVGAGLTGTGFTGTVKIDCVPVPPIQGEK